MISDTQGFNFKSALRVLSEAKQCNLQALDSKGVSLLDIDEKTAKEQFDLAQMTVFDENLDMAEYSDMEFEEFLEFLVRISFVA